MSEVLHLILRIMAEQWKTMDEELIAYRLNQTAEMAEELERERDEARAAFATAINDFVEKVERRAEEKMLLTGKLEGAHYAAMKQIQKEMEAAK